jgi:peroxiredoxin Q/BCP
MFLPSKLKIAAFVACALLSVQLGWANPDAFTLHSATDSKTFKLSDAKGKYVALHFLLKTECPFCLRHTHDYAKKSAGDSRVVHIFLKPDTDEEIKRWDSKLDGAAAKLTIYRDPDAQLAKAYNIPDGYKFHGQTVHYPALVLLDANGKEVFRYIGKSNGDRLSYEKFSAKLKELTEVSPH